LRKLLGETEQQYSNARKAYQNDMRRLGCPTRGSENLDAEKKCANAMTRAEMTEACGAYAGRPPEPKAASPGTPPVGAQGDYPIDQLDRDIRTNLEKDRAYFTEQCARGKQDYCVLATCIRLAFDDSDANEIACARARGFRIGDGWVANGEGEFIKGALRPDWSISITCLKKVDGVRPWVRIWRKFGVPDSAFNLDVEVAKACQAQYNEPRGRGRK
jgi:hypothetical protein